MWEGARVVGAGATVRRLELERDFEKVAFAKLERELAPNEYKRDRPKDAHQPRVSTVLQMQ